MDLLTVLIGSSAIIAFILIIVLILVITILANQKVLSKNMKNIETQQTVLEDNFIMLTSASKRIERYVDAINQRTRCRSETSNKKTDNKRVTSKNTKTKNYNRNLRFKKAESNDKK